MAKGRGEPIGFTDVFGRALDPGVKGYVRNLVTYGDEDSKLPYEATFAFRPALITERVEPRYNKVAPLGNSSDFTTYSSTGSMVWRFEVFQNAIMMLREMGAKRNQSDAVEVAARNAGNGFWNQESRTPPQARGVSEGSANDLKVISDMMQADRRFLMAFCYPAKWGTSSLAEAPPAALLVLPGLLTARCRLIEWNASYEQFDIAGNLRQWRVQVAFEEAPIGRITMEDVLEVGTFREWKN